MLPFEVDDDELPGPSGLEEVLPPGLVVLGVPFGDVELGFCGFVVAGGVVLPGGGVTFPGGVVPGVVDPGGGVAVVPGGVAVPAGGVAVPGGGVAVLPGGVAVPAGGVAVPGAVLCPGVPDPPAAAVAPEEL